MVERFERDLPQRLKPRGNGVTKGTGEAVPSGKAWGVASTGSKSWLCWLASAVLLFSGAACGQEGKPAVPKVVPIPVIPRSRPLAEPTTPPAREFRDARTHVSLRIPAGWNLSRRDGVFSTYREDARTAPKNAVVLAAANMTFNPYPFSTFSGGLFYLTFTPGSTEAACRAQVTTAPIKAISSAKIDDVAFARGADEHGRQCTEARDVAYTTLRGGGCLRFDLVVNTFCGGEVSGARDITQGELENIFRRLEGILTTVKFLKD